MTISDSPAANATQAAYDAAPFKLGATVRQISTGRKGSVCGLRLAAGGASVGFVKVMTESEWQPASMDDPRRYEQTNWIPLADIEAVQQ